MKAIYIGARSSTLLGVCTWWQKGNREGNKHNDITSLESTIDLDKDTCASQSATGARQFKQTFINTCTVNNRFTGGQPARKWEGTSLS